MNGQNNRALDMGSAYAAQLQAKLQACHKSQQQKRSPSSPPLDAAATEDGGTRSDDEEPAESRVSLDEDSQSPAAPLTSVNGDASSVGLLLDDGSNGRTTPASWSKRAQESSECKKLSPPGGTSGGGKALAAS